MSLSMSAALLAEKHIKNIYKQGHLDLGLLYYYYTTFYLKSQF